MDLIVKKELNMPYNIGKGAYRCDFFDVCRYVCSVEHGLQVRHVRLGQIPGPM